MQPGVDMKKPFRTLIAVLVAALGVIPRADAQSGTSVERGRYLVNNIVACGLCHFQTGIQNVPPNERPMAGGFVFPHGASRAVASNITSDPETGIGKWSEADIVRAVREGVRPDGSIIGAPMPIAFYRYLSDDDVNSIAAYLKSVPPVRHAVEKSKYDTPPASYGDAVKGVVAPNPSDKVRYGAYLAQIAHCMDCHTPRDAQNKLDLSKTGAGGSLLKGPWGESLARNLTPHENGLKNWTDDQIIAAIRTGVNPQGVKYKPPMPFAFLKGMSDPDAAALVAYLRSLPPQDYPR